jgi:hypothetical protein
MPSLTRQKLSLGDGGLPREAPCMVEDRGTIAGRLPMTPATRGRGSSRPPMTLLL